MARKIVDLSSLRFDSSSKEECKKELETERWSDGFACPDCGNNKAYILKTRPVLQCTVKTCKKQTSATAGTQLHNCRKLTELWPILKDSQQNDTNLSKSVIAKAMDVSAETARRAARIIAVSFEKKQAKNDTFRTAKQSLTTPPVMAATEKMAANATGTSTLGKNAGVLCRKVLEKLKARKRMLLQTANEHLEAPAKMLDPILLLLFYRSMHLPT